MSKYRYGWCPPFEKCGAVIISRQKAAIAPVDDRGDVAGLLADKNNLIWIDLVRPTADELSWLGETFGFHDLALEDAAKQKQRSKVETFDDHFFVVTHGVRQARSRPLDLVEFHLFVGANYLVDIRYDAFAPLEDLAKNAVESRFLKQGSDFLLYAILDMVVDTYFPAMEKIDDAIDDMDRKVMERPARDDIERIFALKKQLVFMRKHISPQRDVINALVSRDIPEVRSETVFYFRDIYDHVMRIYDDIDFSRDQLTGQLDIYLSQVSNNLNEVMKRLTVFASIFMPITFITGFFGMNFGYIQGKSPAWWIVATVFIGGVAWGNYWWFKRRRWL